MQKLLLEAGVITETILKEALARQEKNPGMPLDKALTETGAVTGREIAGALAGQLQVPFLTLDKISPPLSTLALIPPQIARTHNLLPVLRINNKLIIAVADLPESKILEKLRGLVQMPVHLAIAPAQEIADAVNACYPSQKKSYSQNRQETKGWVWPDSQAELTVRKNTADFFARSRQEIAYENKKFDIFGMDTGKSNRETAKKEIGFEGVLAGASRDSASENAQQHADEKQQAAAALSSGNTKGIEHFEKGLAALQHSSYEEALREFEAALEQDPGNRVCKANIRRIKKVLSEKSEKKD